MTDTSEDPPFGSPEEAADQARARLNQISALFVDMKALTEQWLADPGPAEKSTATKMLTKMGEMQTAHLMMLRAEEAFYDKFSEYADADVIDYEAIRDEIGRALDRIRAQEGPGGLHSQSDP